ncbi:MAG: ArsB/NhaD family transporter [Alphaproteobacteria bacterium]|nr:ArsB/NhaD family transporter [Alphaproteobacteria bacterium]
MLAEGHGAAPGLIPFLADLGAKPIWVASVILAATYAVIVSEKINRVVISLLGAGMMVGLGILTQDAAIRGVDFNTLALLVGMMVIVGIAKDSGMFQYIAIRTAQLVKGDPRMLMMALSLVTAVLSALLDNVTTVMLVVPVSILLCERLKLPVYPFLFSQIFASNTGGAATLIGDPPNIMIGSAVGLSFVQFVENVALPSAICFIVTTLFFDLIWGRKLEASQEDRDGVMKFNAREMITDTVLLRKSLFCIGLALFGFVVGHGHGYEPGSVALFCAAFLMFLDGLGHTPEKQGEKVHHAFTLVEWNTIFFFIGLFIVVYGVEETGLLSLMAEKLLALTAGDVKAMGLVIMWSSAILSAIVDNIPFVATMIPMIKAMGPAMGGDEALLPLWWCLSLGACLGGNGSIVGASANLIVAGFAERAGHRISFLGFMKLAFPLMIVTVMIASVWAWFFLL